MEIKTKVAGTLRQWFCDVGDIVETGESLAEIETDSLDVELASPVAGRVTEMHVLPGDAVTPGLVLAQIEPASPTIGDLLNERDQKQKRKSRAVIARWSPSRQHVILILASMTLFGAMMAGAALTSVRTMTPVIGFTETVSGPIPSTTPFSPLGSTPTARFDYNIWDWTQPLQLVKAVNNWPAGSPVLIRATWIDPVTMQRLYEVSSAATGDYFTVPEALLIPSGLPTPLPTMVFNQQHWSWFYPLILSQTVADFPAGTRVKLINANFVEGQWQLRVVTENGFSLDVREGQLNYPLDVPLNFHQTPVPGLLNYVNLEGYPLVTTGQVDHIPVGIPVRALDFQPGFGEWVYRIMMADDVRVATARESQLRVNEN